MVKHRQPRMGHPVLWHENSISFLAILIAWAKLWKLISWLVTRLEGFLASELQIVRRLREPNFASICLSGEISRPKQNLWQKVDAHYYHSYYSLVTGSSNLGNNHWMEQNPAIYHRISIFNPLSTSGSVSAAAAVESMNWVQRGKRMYSAVPRRSRATAFRQRLTKG